MRSVSRHEVQSDAMTLIEESSIRRHDAIWQSGCSPRTDRMGSECRTDVRRMRAEGHTFESIRLALLDAGISVSRSTVRREAARPPSRWEEEHAFDAMSAIGEPLPDTEAKSVMTPSPPPLGAHGDELATSATGEFSVIEREVFGERGTAGILSRISTVLSRFSRSRWFT